ncbi:MAG: transcriptional regulator, DeoR family [Chthoniobacteraceae bacterium]|nr:transcriptional regulator, DeoR family [Chthoniobacteraceae bacterium]
MKRRLRQRQILELLRFEPELSVDQACERLNASPATIRREFVELAKEGRAEKTWGGIRVLGNEAAAAPAFASRLVVEADGKKAIARAAAELLVDGDVVMIGGGTTTLQLAEFIASKKLRVITNSLVIAQALDQSSRRGAEIHLVGGMLQPECGFVAGAQAESFIKQYHANWAFLGAAGIDETSATNYNETVLASERLMIEQSAKVAILADHTKLGRKAMCLLCPLSEIDHLFTDEFGEEDSLLKQIVVEGVRITRVSRSNRDF